jgi:hypothetical protein
MPDDIPKWERHVHQAVIAFVGINIMWMFLRKATTNNATVEGARESKEARVTRGARATRATRATREPPGA